MDGHITQLDKSIVEDIGELNNVIIHFSFDHGVHQCINIVIMDILEAYGLL